MTVDPRGVAARLLLAAEGPGDFLENRLERDPAFVALPPVDRRLCQDLVYGSLRWQGTLDWLAEEAGAKRPPPPPARVLLRLGLYQLFWLDRIPEFAAVNESVRLATTLGVRPLGAFINAVLRQACRDRPSLQGRLTALRVENPPLGWSHPAWLVERWSRRFGPDSTGKLLAWNNSPPSTYVRCNALKGTPEQLLESWQKEGVVSEPKAFPWIKDGLVHLIHPPGSLAALPSFMAGQFYVQDPSTLLAVRELDPQPGESILDLCSAPGGKTTHIAQQMGNQGSILATDESSGRLDLLVENCERLGVTCVTARSTLKGEIPTAAFDRVLVDSPCSNTGVLRRRIQLRWRLRPEELDRLSRVQLRLLVQAASAVRPGGRLVYSTCSLEAEENGTVIERFLEQNPAFQLLRTTQLHPAIDGVDGAFVATLERRPNAD
jgi:16S rRNA (cytosine967-C5)-methyltransferase